MRASTEVFVNQMENMKEVIKIISRRKKTDSVRQVLLEIDKINEEVKRN